MPEDFVKKIEKIAKEKNGSITIEDSRDNVENGFVLVYGDIEENCQIKALFNGQLDRLKDIANRDLDRRKYIRRKHYGNGLYLRCCKNTSP